MKAIMVKKIELEHVNLPNTDYFEKPLADGPFARLDDSAVAAMETMRTEVYRRIEVIDEGGRRINYMVKLDENNLFTQLVEVGAETVRERIREAIEKFKIEEVPRYERAAMARENKRIAALPWWKRLFKKF